MGKSVFTSASEGFNRHGLTFMPEDDGVWLDLEREFCQQAMS
jgi:hypothetical protein